MKSEQTNNENTDVLETTNAPVVETEYVDEFGNPIDPSLIDEFGNYIGDATEYVDEFGNPIDPSLIDEFGNYIGDAQDTLNLETDQASIAESLSEASEIVASASERQMDDKELMQGMVTFDYNNVPITDIVNSIILDAINKGASDIHFDPFDEGIKIRIRIDGQLNDYSIVPLFVKKNMITRVKIISGMNITESRVPQDGAIRTELANKTIDLRVSCLPTNMGEKIVVRIMDYSMSAAGIEALDFNKKNLEKVKKMLELPNGIILVTGATGSGKSTTVYSMLQKLNVEGTNLITVEDPIEMNIGGINQVQAVSEIGLTFATVLRSILRQDPDVIMIGEIRDDETARIAVRASITGHLVLSTIHTNNSLNTIERLTDMSVERYLLGTALSGIVSQKLARRLCEKCKKLRPTNDYEKEIFKKVLEKDIEEIYEPVGCPHCARGYRGRIAIQEVLLLNQAIQDAITKGVDKNILRKLVYGENGTETMLEDGLEKVLEGKTSFDEIIKLIDLEDDLGTGTQLGLTDQIEASRMENQYNGPINLGNSPININITPELLNGLNNLGNLIPKNIQEEKTTENNNKDEEIKIVEEKQEDKPIEALEDGPAILFESPTVAEPETLKTTENLEEIEETEFIEPIVEEKEEILEVLDEKENEILPEEIQELDNEVLETEEISTLEVLEDNSPSLDELIKRFENNLNQVNKKKFILNTKKIVNELNKYDIHNELVIDIVKKYIEVIKNTTKIRITDKNDLINLFNHIFGINEELDEIDKLTEESLETIDYLETTANDIGLSENEIDSILGTNQESLIDVSIDHPKNDLIIEKIEPTKKKQKKKNKSKKSEQIKEIELDNNHNDIQIDILDDSIEKLEEPEVPNNVAEIPEITIDDDVDFSAIDDSLINSLIDNLGDIKEDE
ncbi:MAG: Flp pilus assembly complex ATPase component TadA [Bacilli bacterium]|jgi:type II secretory ATPase GspE/PulE/Tfp pilus assembly ATPase PilB-like protein|nr:Flp pilus assembly complex ATPase component TadA [Bacilli bacterium]